MIKYLLILESELKNIDLNEFKVIFSVDINNSEKIYFLEKKFIFNIVADLKKNITPVLLKKFETVFCILSTVITFAWLNISLRMFSTISNIK